MLGAPPLGHFSTTTSRYRRGARSWVSSNSSRRGLAWRKGEILRIDVAITPHASKAVGACLNCSAHRKKKSTERLDWIALNRPITTESRIIVKQKAVY